MCFVWKKVLVCSFSKVVTSWEASNLRKLILAILSEFLSISGSFFKFKVDKQNIRTIHELQEFIREMHDAPVYYHDML